jgi:hypothetical protein
MISMNGGPTLTEDLGSEKVTCSFQQLAVNVLAISSLALTW